MNWSFVRRAGELAICLSVFLALGASAQDTQTSIAPVTRPTAKELDGARSPGTKAKSQVESVRQDPEGAVSYSPGVEEVLKMLQSGVSVEVTKAFIESSPIAYQLTAADVIALKKEAVPDEITRAMIKRGADLRAQASRLRSFSPRSAVASLSHRRLGALDPESYEYFQYYYLYPRTLAAANHRLFSPPPTFSRAWPYPYNYGYYGPTPYGPFPPLWHP